MFYEILIVFSFDNQNDFIPLCKFLLAVRRDLLELIEFVETSLSQLHLKKSNFFLGRSYEIKTLNG